jgi:hypothetical protein
MQSEQDIETECIDWLNSNSRILAFKFPRGQKARTRRNTIRHSGNGVSDIICNYSSFGICWVVYLEVKAKRGKLRESQEIFRDRVREQSGFFYVVRSVEDCMEALMDVDLRVPGKIIEAYRRHQQIEDIPF